MLKKSLLTAFLLLSTHVALAADPLHNTRWQTFDDETGNAKGVVEITEKNGLLFGKIIKILAEGGDGACTTCKGQYAGKSLIGATIIKNLQPKGRGKYADGSIIDPEKGKTYKLKTTLKANRLIVRGFIGVSLLGRTQTWKKLP